MFRAGMIVASILSLPAVALGQGGEAEAQGCLFPCNGPPSCLGFCACPNNFCHTACTIPACNVLCGGSPCNPGCPDFCNPVLCPGNICSPTCGDPDCKLVCGGGPCDPGCAARCDNILCALSNNCDPFCGGSSCNIGCSPCGAGCPEFCNAVLCPLNALCNSTCGGDRCNVGCGLVGGGPCSTGCPDQCFELLCPLNFCDPECDPECKLICGGDPCDPACGDPTCNLLCGGGPCNPGCPLECNPVVCVLNICAPQCDANCTFLVDLFNGVTSIVQNIVDGLIAVVNDARDRAGEALTGINTIGQQVQQGLSSLTGQVRTAIGDGIEDLARTVQNELAGLAAFVGGPLDGGCAPVCEQFRSDFVMLLTNIQTISNCLFDVSGQGAMAINLDREIGIVQNLPGRVLFPIYRVLGQESDLFGAGILQQLNDLAANILEVKQLIVVASCDLVLQDQDRAKELVRSLSLAASGLKLIGKGLIASGETQFFPDAGIHGYVHVNVQNNSRKKWGERLVGLSESILAVSQSAGRKIASCIDLNTKQENVSAVLLGQQDILNKITCGGDMDGDGNIGLQDYTLFQALLTGPVALQRGAAASKAGSGRRSRVAR